MRIAALQTEIIWENPSANYELISKQLQKLKNVDLIILPEMFTTGFSMDTQRLAEKKEGPTLNWMKALAYEKKSAVTGSVIIKEDQKYYNRLYWVYTSGEYKTYDKRHLFRMANEDQFYNAGKDRLIVKLKDFNICPMICYDLRFPVWSRNINDHKQPLYDCLIYVANWPEARADAWISLLKARAIENQAFVIGVNRIGIDNNKISYCGGSSVFDPRGKRVDNFLDHQQGVEIITLNRKELIEFRKKFPVSMDADNFRFIE